LEHVSTVAIVETCRLPTFHILLALAEETATATRSFRTVAAHAGGELKAERGNALSIRQRMLEQGTHLETRDRPRRRRRRRAPTLLRITPQGWVVGRPKRVRLALKRGKPWLRARKVGS
jgi:hypothetical protein